MTPDTPPRGTELPLNRADPYHLLGRSQQVIILRLRTGHNKLKFRMHSKFGIGDDDQCPCLSAAMTADHILQTCPNYSELRCKIWPEATTTERKLFGSLVDLQDTAAFIEGSGLSI